MTTNSFAGNVEINYQFRNVFIKTSLKLQVKKTFVLLFK